jgi:SAM-dependent methyltransferase
METKSERHGLRQVRDQINFLSTAEGFFHSRILFTLLKLGVFEHIGAGEKSLDELAAALGARPETLARLLNAGVVLKLLQSDDGVRCCLPELSRSVLLTSAGEAYLGNWIRNLAYFDAALSALDQAVLKSEPTINPASHRGANREETREFTLAMHNYASLRGKELARYLDTRGCCTMLDLGSGPGTYSFHLGLANPELELSLVDSAGVLEVAKEVQAQYPLANKVHYLPADVLKDEIAGEYDLILISNALHMLGPDASRELIRRLYRSVRTGGSLVVQAQFLRDDRMGERWPIVVDLVQLCITDAGRNHSVAETRGWLIDAGFEDTEYRTMSLFNTNSYLRAYKRK